MTARVSRRQRVVVTTSISASLQPCASSKPCGPEQFAGAAMMTQDAQTGTRSCLEGHLSHRVRWLAVPELTAAQLTYAPVCTICCSIRTVVPTREWGTDHGQEEGVHRRLDRGSA